MILPFSRSLAVKRLTDKPTPLTDRIFCLDRVVQQTPQQSLQWPSIKLISFRKRIFNVHNRFNAFVGLQSDNRRIIPSSNCCHLCPSNCPSISWWFCRRYDCCWLEKGTRQAIQSSMSLFARSKNGLTVHLGHFLSKRMVYSFDNRFHWTTLIVLLFGVIATITLLRTWPDKNAFDFVLKGVSTTAICFDHVPERRLCSV